VDSLVIILIVYFSQTVDGSIFKLSGCVTIFVHQSLIKSVIYKKKISKNRGIPIVNAHRTLMCRAALSLKITDIDRVNDNAAVIFGGILR